MTRVDFYRVRGNLDGAVDLSCHLVDQALQTNHDVLIHIPHGAALATLEERLWTAAKTSFMPHRCSKSGPERIQLLTDEIDTTDPGNDSDSDHGLLINFLPETPVWFGRFAKVCELIYGEEEFIEIKRIRYQFYRDRGFPLHYHDMTAQF
jgi:DNA polymerase III subunit chi